MSMGNAVTQILGIDFVKNQWFKAINAFKASEVKFRAAYADLTANRKKYYDAGLGQQYDLVFNKGRLIQNSVGNVINATRKIYDYFNSPSNLGNPFIAAIPIGSIIGITAIIGSFILAYNVLQKALIEYNIRQLPPEQQAAARQKLIGDIAAPIGSGISNSVYAIGALILAVMILPKFMEKK